MGLIVIVRREPIYSILLFRETHVTTLECVEWDFFLMQICALTLDVERPGTHERSWKYKK